MTSAWFHKQCTVLLTERSVQNKIQIIHSKSRHHGVVASAVNCCLDEVKIYGSLYQFYDNELKLTIENLFSYDSNKPVTKVTQSLRQKGSTDWHHQMPQPLYLLSSVRGRGKRRGRGVRV